MSHLDIALVGDYDETVLAHQAIPRALELAARHLGVGVTGHWVDTDRLATSLAPLSEMAGVWCVPASPYRSAAGALAGTTPPIVTAFLAAATADRTTASSWTA